VAFILNPPPVVKEDQFPIFTEEQLRAVDIHELLPQQEPFVMVGSLVHIDETITITETPVSPENIFVDDGMFSAAGLIENVAQTCAVRIGFVNKYIDHRDIQIGVIGTVKKFRALALPKVGQVIVTRVEKISEILGTTLCKAVVTCGDQTLVTTDIKISVREEET